MLAVISDGEAGPLATCDECASDSVWRFAIDSWSAVKAFRSLELVAYEDRFVDDLMIFIAIVESTRVIPGSAINCSETNCS